MDDTLLGSLLYRRAQPLLIALFLLVTVPLVELYLLIEIGRGIGALYTIALCLLTAALGTALLRQQGIQTLARARVNLDRGTLPAIELMEGVALAVGGVLLLTPGFVTDVIGFACLLPPTRRVLVSLLLRRVKTTRSGADHPGRITIEGEYERRDRPHE